MNKQRLRSKSYWQSKLCNDIKFNVIYMKMNYYSPAFIFSAIILLSGCGGNSSSNDEVMPTSDDGMKETVLIEEGTLVQDHSSEEMEKVEKSIYDGTEPVLLTDVSGGKAIGQAWIVVDTAINVTSHRMVAQNLPVPLNGDFYEGWIVSSPTAPGGVLSTGVMLQQEDGTWLLDYGVDQALPEHKTIVLTLEPDDGDPAPAEHILEGKFK